MSSLLKRFNRDPGSENDYVLVFTLSEDKIGLRTAWEAVFFNDVRLTMFPYNVLLLELAGTEHQTALANGYKVDQIQRMHYYCNEDEAVCWQQSWPPQDSRLQKPPDDSHQFPGHKLEFDASYSRVVRDWHQNFYGWSIYLYDDGKGSSEYLHEIPFRDVIGPAPNFVQTWKSVHIPNWFLVLEIVRALNATLESMLSGRGLSQTGAKIQPNQFMTSLTPKSFLLYRNYPVGTFYFQFAYGKNGSRGIEAGNILVIFSPFSTVTWVGLVITSVAIVILLRTGANFSALDTLACLVLQSTVEVTVSRKLAPLFLLWSIISVFIANFYSGFIESALAVPSMTPGIEDFKELSRQGYRPVVNPDEKITLNSSFRGYKFTDALINNSDVQNFPQHFSPEYVRYLAKNENRCAIFFGQNILQTRMWIPVAQFFAPTVTWTLGKDLLLFSPTVWSIKEPNAALLYYILGILHSRGFITQFEKYGDEKTLKYDEELRNSAKGREIGYGRVFEAFTAEGTSPFSINNPQMLRLFQGYAAFNSLGLLILLIEVTFVLERIPLE